MTFERELWLEWANGQPANQQMWLGVSNISHRGLSTIHAHTQTWICEDPGFIPVSSLHLSLVQETVHWIANDRAVTEFLVTGPEDINNHLVPRAFALQDGLAFENAVSDSSQFSAASKQKAYLRMILIHVLA